MCPDFVYLSEQGYSDVVSGSVILRTPEKKEVEERKCRL